MAKIILEFDSIEEFEEAVTAINAGKWKSAMFELDQKLRSTTKYGQSIIEHNKKATNQEIETVEAVRELIKNILDDYQLSIP
jgi:hypothetical protein